MSCKIVFTAVESELKGHMCCCSGGGSSWGFQICVLDFVGPGVKHLFHSSGGDLQASDSPALTLCLLLSSAQLFLMALWGGSV